MKVAGNRIKHLEDYYHSELDGLYGNEEVNSLFSATLEHYLGYKKNEFRLKREDNVNQSDLLLIYDTCKELKAGKPLQYILHEAWFYNLKLYVDENVLIPRPETEELADIILKKNKSAQSLLDLGTGSGCIPIAIKKQLPQTSVYACDVSAGALSVAKKNAAKNNVDITFFEANILKDDLTKRLPGKMEIIVSNPPYIKTDEKQLLHKNVIDHEPHLALFVNGNDDILFYRRIIDLCKNLLSAKGKLYFELNPLTAEKVRSYAKDSGSFGNVELIRDMSGKMRFLEAIKK
jgi:release factor glutamine methyltransferase